MKSLPLAAAAVLLLTGATGFAQTLGTDNLAPPATEIGAPPDTAEDRAIVTFQVENDVFNRIGRSDRDYTNGVRLGWLSAPTMMPDWLAAATTVPTFFGEPPSTGVVRRYGISVGQNLYTPQDTDTSAPILNDRPYAAWLYAGFALQYIYSHGNEPVRMDTLQLDVGVVGPAAGGEFVQNNFHHLIGVATANGWANQLHNEPTLGLTFERQWRIGRRVFIEDPRLEVDFVPRIGVEIGNAATFASVGGTFRIGKDLRNDFGPSRSRPALPGSESFAAKSGFAWYFFAGFDGEAWARNMFLQGNLDGQSQSVTMRPFVGEVQAGLALIFRGMRISYTQVLRSPDFYQQARFDQFGSVNVAFRF
jgi:lipid A 3-O-deacylase